jgi:hypothetical protein
LILTKLAICKLSKAQVDVVSRLEPAIAVNSSDLTDIRTLILNANGAAVAIAALEMCCGYVCNMTATTDLHVETFLPLVSGSQLMVPDAKPHYRSLRWGEGVFFGGYGGWP